jgi:hypothetical protein
MATKDISDLEVVEAYIQFKVSSNLYGIHDQWPYLILMAWTGECEKVCYRALERAHRRGLIEYGVSLRSGWVTQKGMGLVAEHIDKICQEELCKD